MEDRKIIELLWRRDSRGLDSVIRQYEGYCYAIASRILGNPRDAEECVSDTWLQAWNRIPPHRPAVLRMFLAKLTRDAACSRLRAEHAQKRGSGQLELALEELSECLTEEQDAEDAVIAAELGKSIRDFVRGLPEREGDVFARRYFFTESVQEIARGYGMTENNVSVMLHRTRRKLKNHLIREGYIYEKTGPL